MAVSQGFKEMLSDLFAPLGPVSVRRMFGGAGIFSDGVMFALAVDDTLYLKTEDGDRPGFEAEGCGPFAYEAKGRRIVLSYWRMPDRLLDDPDEAVNWARQALAVARRSAAATAASGKSKSVRPAIRKGSR